MTPRNLTFTERSILAPQTQAVLAYMRSKGSITQRDALIDMSVQSLTRQISFLNQSGLVTVAGTFKYHPVSGQRYKTYHLVNDTKQARRR